MERRASDSQKRSSQIKLPAINYRKGDSSKTLSSTMPDTGKTRPSSMYKVQDLQKKLFDKLESYQLPSKKNLKRGTRKKIQGENSLQPQVEGFQRIQKLMPGLFTKLVEAKKSVALQQSTQTEGQQLVSQPRIGKQIFTAEHKRRKTEAKQTSVQKQQRQSNTQLEMSQQEYDQVYREYSRREQLGPETSGEQLAAMGQSLQLCEKQIQKLTKSMDALVRELASQCIRDFQLDDEDNSR